MTTGTFSLRAYLRDHSSLYIFISVLFAMGVMFGAVLVNALTLEQKQEMLEQVSSFFYTLTDQSLDDGKVIFAKSFGMHIKWILLIWLLGLSVIGLPLIFVLDFLKGVLIGFTVGYLVGQFSWSGVVFSLVSVAPQNLIVIPVLLISSVTAAAFSIRLVKSRILKNDNQAPILPSLIRFTAIIAAMCVLLAGISLYEGYVSPIFMRSVTPELALP